MKIADFSNNINLAGDSIDDPDSQDPEIQSQYRTIFEKNSKLPNDLKQLVSAGNWITEVELKKIADILVDHQNLRFFSLK